MCDSVAGKRFEERRAQYCAIALLTSRCNDTIETNRETCSGTLSNKCKQKHRRHYQLVNLNLKIQPINDETKRCHVKFVRCMGKEGCGTLAKENDRRVSH
ncbi:hypothetical protein CBL_01825 [Carabus blaptoides fortunei]